MESCKYLVIGGGRAADAAVRGIRELDRTGSILVMSDENDPPYDRPPLSKALWKGNAVDTVWRQTERAGAEIPDRAEEIGTISTSWHRIRISRITRNDTRGLFLSRRSHGSHQSDLR